MEPFIGQIQPFGFSFAPVGWTTCDGQLLSISENNALFSLLGTTYGGDGRSSFALPDLRGRSIVHVGHGPGLNPIYLGERAGKEYETLTTNNMPAHNHAVAVGVSTVTGSEADSTSILANQAGGFNEDVSSGSHLGGVINNDVGGGQSFNIRNPFLGINMCIALDGVYPSRS